MPCPCLYDKSDKPNSYNKNYSTSINSNIKSIGEYTIVHAPITT